MQKILITGVAGFIGFHLAKRLLEANESVVGVDIVNDYYCVKLKAARLEQLESYPKFEFIRMDLSDRSATGQLFRSHTFDRVVHLAAQAGVRYSIDNPSAYIDANLVATSNVLEGCRHSKTPHLLYASSSSVYGANLKQPFSTRQNVDHPVSLYAATKKANELMAHTYSHLFRLPTTGLRFFTVYGPWGRPDMALYKFTKAIFEGKPIEIYNYGKMRRDFTYVDDITQAIHRLLDTIPEPNPDWNGMEPDAASSHAPYRVHNIGSHRPTELTKFIEIIEQVTGIEAKKVYLPIQMGDVPSTFADVSDLQSSIAYVPSTSIEEGVERFVEWYREYHRDELAGSKSTSLRPSCV